MQKKPELIFKISLFSCLVFYIDLKFKNKTYILSIKRVMFFVLRMMWDFTCCMCEISTWSLSLTVQCFCAAAVMWNPFVVNSLVDFHHASALTAKKLLPPTELNNQLLHPFCRPGGFDEDLLVDLEGPSGTFSWMCSSDRLAWQW